MNWSITENEQIKISLGERRTIICDNCPTDLTDANWYVLLNLHYEGFRYCLPCAKSFLEKELEDRVKILDKIKELI